MIEAGREAHRLGKFAGALAAARAFFQIDVAGLRREGSLEMACLPGKAAQLGHRLELDVQLAAAFREMG